MGLGCLVSATSERRDLMIWEASLGWPRGFLLSLGLAFGRVLADEKDFRKLVDLVWWGD